MNYNSNIKLLKSIIIIHKIYGWALIIFTLLSIVAITFGFSFASVLKAYGVNSFGNLLIMSYYINIFISIFLGLLYLYIAKELKNEANFAIYLSFFTLILVVLLFSSPITYIFSVIVTILWLWYFRLKKVVFMVLPLLFIGVFYSVYKNQKSDLSNEESASLHVVASSYGSLADLEKELNAGVDPNIANEDGITALFYASYSTEKIKLLMNYGANINHQDIDGRTILHEAVKWSNYILVKSLLSYDASVMIKDNRGKTAKNLAVQEYNKDNNEKRKKIMELILLKSSK